MRDEQVAVVYGENGCELIAKVKVLSHLEINKLENEYERNKSKKLKKYSELESRLNQHDKELGHLFNQELLLAKALYDKFVDRGLIDEDKDFDQKFYDFIFNGKQLSARDYPDDFKKILEKVGTL